MPFQQGLIRPGDCILALKWLRRSALRFCAQLELYDQPELVRDAKVALRAGLELQQTRNLASYDAPSMASAQWTGCNTLSSEAEIASETKTSLHLIKPLA